MSRLLDHLRRYEPIVDDLEAFLAAAARPLPRVVWANPLRADPEAVEARLRAACPAAAPVGWRPHTWRLPADASPGLLDDFRLGMLHAQEEAALLAGDALGARPGERVLDLCAAPGGKTVQAAVAMADRGTLVANDRYLGRLPALRRTLDRLGVTCAAVTCADGKSFPGEAGWYDRVLVDAPCTCEGTSRKQDTGRTAAVDPRYRASVVQLQKALLRRAIRLTRSGGVVVYATCTYAPEENEAVLDAIDPAEAVVEPLPRPPGLHLAPAATAWRGRRFREDVRHAARLWPHHNDTGGFFVARLRRV